jgi:hypothetical protein
VQSDARSAPREESARVVASRSSRTVALVAGDVRAPHDPAAARAARRHLAIGFAKLIAGLIADGSLDPAEIS